MKVYFPWNNLGCLGFKVGKAYFDVFRLQGFPYFGLFINNNGVKYRWSLRKGFRRTEM